MKTCLRSIARRHFLPGWRFVVVFSALALRLERSFVPRILPPYRARTRPTAATADTSTSNGTGRGQRDAFAGA